MTKSRRMRRTWHVARMGTNEKCVLNFNWKTWVKKHLLGDQGVDRRTILKCIFKNQPMFDGVGCIWLGQGPVAVITVLDLLVSRKVGNILTIWGTIRTFLHGFCTILLPASPRATWAVDPGGVSTDHQHFQLLRTKGVHESPARGDGNLNHRTKARSIRGLFNFPVNDLTTLGEVTSAKYEDPHWIIFFSLFLRHLSYVQNTF
jgi:hypothetical protein